jgi:hypothetical protein
MNKKYLERPEAADYLTKRGLRVSKNTLQKYGTIGGGPVYRKFGNRALYTPDDLDAWVEGKLTAPRASSSAA